jgi:thiol-disulfide isomerase/thioredoxin
MVRTSGIGGLCLFITCATATAARADEAPFRDLSLDQARRTAADGGKKFVLVDFYTTWCEPCKKLDQTTWKDQGVKDWLAKEAVCLKIDAEKETALANKYRINMYPTVLMLRPDGAEIDRLVGYRDAKTFLADARAALAGNDSLSRARKPLEGAGANDPMLRRGYADALAQKGRTEDALSEYLWCFDHGHEHRQSFAGVRVSFLLREIVQLGRTHPAALDELRKRRDAARKVLEGGRDDFSKALDFASINQNLGEPEKTLALYDAIKDAKSVSPRTRQYLASQSLDQLLQARRYKDALDGADTLVAIQEMTIAHHLKGKFALKDENVRTGVKRMVIADGAKLYEAMIGAGDQARAAACAKRLIDVDRDAAYPALIAAATRAGDARTADALNRESRESKKPAAEK